MWTVKEEGSKEHDFQLDLVHPMLMVSWIMGLCPFLIIFMLHDASVIFFVENESPSICLKYVEGNKNVVLLTLYYFP